MRHGAQSLSIVTSPVPTGVAAHARIIPDPGRFGKGGPKCVKVKYLYILLAMNS
jgi:hypothetical protein